MLSGLIFRVSIQKTFMLRGELIGKNRTRRDAGEQGKCRTTPTTSRHAGFISGFSSCKCT